MRYLQLFFKTIYIQMKSSWARPMFRFTLLINPILTTIMICEIFINSGRENFSVYIILGSSLMSLWTNICFSSVGDINRERRMGILPYLYTSPANFNVVIIAKMLGNITLSMLSVIITIVFSYLFYGVKLSIAHPWWLLLSILIAIISFSIISILVSYVMLLTRKTSLYMNLIDTPIIILSGFAFPVTILPESLQILSYLLLPTWVVKLITEILTQGITSLVSTYIIIVFLMMLCYMIVTYFLWKVVKTKVKKTASLEVF